MCIHMCVYIYMYSYIYIYIHILYDYISLCALCTITSVPHKAVAEGGSCICWNQLHYA